jgi:cellulose synthase/poly-beta-1,6-N-acetylglucosamine synthase-like glycosyltransferase
MVLFLGVCWLLVGVYAFFLLYYSYLFVKLPATILPPGYQPTTSITVIIPARNEANNITSCLQSILHCGYPSHLLQIIVVDDFSEDATAEIVGAFKKVTLLQLSDIVQSKINSYKKKAIEYAIEHATGSLIVTTDADCIAPVNWLHYFDFEYKINNAKCVAAPVLIKPVNNFISLFQQIDFMCLQGITAVAVANKQLTMSSGANFGYDKDVFNEVNGFAGIDDVASGDDMLLMHKIFEKYPTQVCYLNSSKAIVTTQPVQTVGAFFNQRIRWASKSTKYKDKRILPVLLIVYGVNLFLFFGLMYAIFFNQQWLGSLGYLLLVKILAQLFFVIPVAQFYGIKHAIVAFIFAEPFHIVYTIIAGWLAKFGTYTWKDRKVN